MYASFTVYQMMNHNMNKYDDMRYTNIIKFLCIYTASWQVPISMIHPHGNCVLNGKSIWLYIYNVYTVSMLLAMEKDKLLLRAGKLH